MISCLSSDMGIKPIISELITIHFPDQSCASEINLSKIIMINAKEKQRGRENSAEN